MHLTIIAKAPVAGRVKTRMCPPLTHDEAAAVAAAALADTFDAALVVARSERVEPVLLLDGERQAWMPGIRVVSQRGGGLGERLANGFADLGPGVIVGMETPDAVPFVSNAFAALRSGVDAIGLATDGGYWCIGLTAQSASDPHRLFESVPMSRSDTGLAQLRRLHAAGRPVRVLPMARDLDDVDDLRAVASRRGDGARLAELARTLTCPTVDAGGVTPVGAEAVR